MRRPVLVTPPDILPVSLAEAKAHLRVDYDDDDALIASLIGAAVDHLDGWTGILGRCLVEQEWRQDFAAGASCFPLPLGPVIEITSVTAGGETVDQSGYSLIVDGGGAAFMVPDHELAGSVSVAFRAGNRANPQAPGVSTVPAAIKAAILLMVGNWYQTAEAVNIGNIVNEMPMGVRALLAPWIVRRI